MTELLTSVGIWAVVLTLGLYQLGLWIQKKTGLALCNPILFAAAAVILLLLRLAFGLRLGAGADGLGGLSGAGGVLGGTGGCLGRALLALSGTGLVAYLICALIIPEKPADIIDV